MAVFYTDTGSINILEISSSLLVSGNFIISGNLDSTQGLTGSLLGTASWANNSISASYALFASNAQTSSYVLDAVSSSFATRATTASFITPLRQDVIITGSLIVSGATNNEVIIRGDTMITGALMISGSSAIELDVRGATNLVGDTTITGSVIISGSSNNIELIVRGDTIITGSLIVSGSGGTGVFSKGGTIADLVNGVSTSGSYLVWRAPFSCSVVALYGRRENGTAAQVNARRSGSAGYSLHTGSNLILTAGSVWSQANTVTNTAYVAGDSLEVVMSGSSCDQIAVQVDFIRVL